MNTLSPHLLIIGLTWPEPQSSAAGSRMMQLIQLFESEAWTITFASPAQPTSFSEDLNARGITTLQIDPNRSETTEKLKDLLPDVVLFDRFVMEEQLGWRIQEMYPDALRILDTEDLHLLRQARQKAVRENRELKESDLYTTTAKREIAAILRCDLSLIISEPEYKLLVDTFKLAPDLLHYLPFLLEPISTAQKKQLPLYEHRAGFMFIGNFRHPPNYDAVVYLKTKIWPLIRKELAKVKMKPSSEAEMRSLSGAEMRSLSGAEMRSLSGAEMRSLSGAEMIVYGAYMPQKVKQLENKKEGFIVKGRAKDLPATFRKHRVLLAPLRFGAGLKGKLVEAMQNGTPAVSTTMGAEGICGTLAFPGAVADQPEVFARAAVSLYLKQQDWKKAQDQGRTILHTRFDKEKFERDFLHRLDHLRTQLKQHRQTHFIGQLLNHHRQQSTKYMSRWIEAKHKQNS